jgi:hypothetical protein
MKDEKIISCFNKKKLLAVIYPQLLEYNLAG